MVITNDDPRDWSWSSNQVVNRPALSQWSTLLSEQIAEMAVTSPEGSSFQASWTRYGMEALELNFLRCGRQTVTRSTEMVARGDRPYFELLYARRGKILSDHAGVKSSTPQGGFVMLNDQLAYELEFPDGSDCLSVRMPQDWAAGWSPGASGLVGKPVSGGDSWGRPLAGMLTAIADFGPASTTVTRATMSEQLGSMFMLLGGALAAPPTTRDALPQRIFDVLRDRHADPELDPDAVARELAISRRHLHRVLARGGSSFGRMLNDIRLTQAEALLKANGDRAPIGDVAWRVGFADQSHFARLFKNRHGLTPSQYRADSD